MPLPSAERRFRPWMAVPLLVTTAAMALASFTAREPEPLDARPLPHQDRIASRLAAPPPSFPAGAGVDRDWGRLAPAFSRTMLALFSRMAELGYELTLLEGYRSPERQTALAASGRGVTRAEAFRSLHQYGLAADLGFVKDGSLVVSERDPWAREAYETLGREAGLLGLNWGGTWAFRDLCHVEASLAPATRPWRSSALPAIATLQVRP